MNCDLDNEYWRRNYYYCFYRKTANDEEHRVHSGDAVKKQGSGCDKYSVKERNWENNIT